MSYIKEAITTEAPITEDIITRAEQLIRTNHAICGLGTELVELCLSADETNIKEELGDLLWYLAILCDEWKLNFVASEFETCDPYRGLSSEVGQLIDLYKRAVFYGQTFEPMLAQQAVSSILSHVASIAFFNGFTVNDVQECNIAKLRRRYPNKFTQYDAVNRDVKNELEGF